MSNLNSKCRILSDFSYKNVMRQVELKSVDWHIIIECYLSQIGIVNSKDISKKIVRIFKLTDELLTTKSLVTTNIRTFINIIDGCYK